MNGGWKHGVRERGERSSVTGLLCTFWLGQAEARSQKYILVCHVGAGTKYVCALPLSSQITLQGSGSEVKQLRLEPAPIWNVDIIGCVLTGKVFFFFLVDTHKCILRPTSKKTGFYVLELIHIHIDFIAILDVVLLHDYKITFTSFFPILLEKYMKLKKNQTSFLRIQVKYFSHHLPSLDWIQGVQAAS